MLLRVCDPFACDLVEVKLTELLGLSPSKAREVLSPYAGTLGAELGPSRLSAVRASAQLST